MQRLQVIMLGLAIATGSACGDDDYDYAPPRALTPSEQALVAASNQFGFGFFSEVVNQSPSQNLFVSPLSVSMALGMAYNGARGSTARGMAEALAYGDMSLSEVNASYRSLIELLMGMDPDVTLEIANSVWHRQSFSVLPAFLDACKKYFDALVTALDFADSEAPNTINAWVADQTHGKIDSIVDSIDPLMMMFLINAIYFKGDWTTQFSEEATHTSEFHALGGETRSVPMMHLDTDVGVFAGESFAGVHLPYGHEHFGMSILLPNTGSTTDDVVAELSKEAWHAWMASVRMEERSVFLPRFELEYEETLNSVLAALGMEEAFDCTAADFSGINQEMVLCIDEVKHKSYVKVNEQGTEAAAVTSVGIRTVSAPQEFRVDRPFVFVIHDSHSQSLLFIGRIVDLPDA